MGLGARPCCPPAGEGGVGGPGSAGCPAGDTPSAWQCPGAGAHGSADLDRDQPSPGFPRRGWIGVGCTDSCSFQNCSEFILVPGVHIPSFLSSASALFFFFSPLQAMYFSMCCLCHFSLSCSGFLLHLLFLPSGSPGLTWYSELPELDSKIGLC